MVCVESIIDMTIYCGRIKVSIMLRVHHEPLKTSRAVSTDIFNKIKKFYDEFTDSEKKVEAAKKVQEASRKTREKVTLELAKCQIGEMDKLERKVKALSAANINEEVNGR